MTNINLNLLKALDALLSAQNVSRAADRVGITQSGMSITLAQLRDIYKDDLLVRGTQGRMLLTPFAKILIQPVREALQQAEAVFEGHLPFQAGTATRTFHVGMSDYIAFVILPGLMRNISRAAPGIKIVHHALNHLDSLSPFEEQNLDIIIGDFKAVPRSLKVTKLFTDRGVIVADKGHPAFRSVKLTTDKLVEYPQVFVALEGYPEVNFIADMIKKMGHEVDIRLMTPHTLIALQALPGTELMTNTVEKLAKPLINSLGLAMRETPYKLEKYDAKLYWHTRDQNDEGHAWLRSMIKKIADRL
jgi:LysR family transcriptional activator of mexEF-oprN operon